MFKYLAFALTVCYALSGQAASQPIAFKPVDGQTMIKFEATQAGAIVRGEFKKSTSEIKFSPDALESSKVKTTIFMDSYTTNDADAQTELKNDAWFNVGKFPEAVFETTSFKSLGDKKYEADANLTIKGHSVPVAFVFTLNNFSSSGADINGEVTIKRNDFDIGDKSTDSIKDEVRVIVVMKAEKL